MIVYNEIDPFAAAWLRELGKANMIAPGEVWENDIRDIRPADLKGVIQFHGFAGIGGWSYAARLAGWPDDRPLWTMSCPCQPFSAAGQGAGFADERHLWPHAHWLISQCRPPVVAGEQVASKSAEHWIDLVQDDMEALDYAFGAVPFPSASVGAPHIRDRLYWVADAQRHSGGCEASPANHIGAKADRSADQRGGHSGASVRMGNAAVEPSGRSVASGCGACWVAYSDDDGPLDGVNSTPRRRAKAASEYCCDSRPGPTNGFWRDADWLHCRDGKWRPVEPGTFPLAHGAAARVGRLRGYGNAINAVQAQIFIETVKEIVDG